MDSDEATAKKRPKKSSKKEQSLERIIERLPKIHNDKWKFGEYRLWATALVKKQLFIINSNSKVEICITVGLGVGIHNFHQVDYFHIW